VGHGSAAGGQSLDLEDGQTLTSTKVRGLATFRTAFARLPTLVLLNACEVGRPAPALSGVGGLVQALIRQRAGGVIAALWSVEDSIAHKIAAEFYEEALKEPARPFADILRAIRARAYDEANPLEDSYAAYCFYGDPQACRG
jgi:CHAT domain-containing protein